MSGIFETLSNIVPTLASLVLGKGGEVATALAVKAVGKVFGVGPDDVGGVLEQAAKSNDPEIRLKLMEAERALKSDLMQHAQAMRALGIQEYQTQTGDLADVRRMITATGDKTSSRLAYMTYGGFIVIVIGFVLMFIFDKAPKDPNVMLIFGAILGNVFALSQQALAVFTGAIPPSQIGRSRLPN